MCCGFATVGCCSVKEEGGVVNYVDCIAAVGCCRVCVGVAGCVCVEVG